MNRKVDDMTHKNRMEVLKYIMTLNIKIVECGDGSRINLDKLCLEELKGLEDMINKIINSLSEVNKL